MPLPKPKEDEDRTDQRYAVCLTQWNERDNDE